MEMKKVEEELKKGWEATSQLRELILGLKGEDSKNNRVMKESIELDNEKMLTLKNNCYSTIINSFDTCISILNSNMVASNNPQINSSRRGSTPNHGAENHALRNFGQFKSKHPRVKTIETKNLTSDAYIWRKYGRKPIQHAQHPREYFRCAYRDDQNCQATKHVQMISNNPTKYVIKYYSQHTCQPDFHSNNLSRIQNEIDFNDKECSNLISFESKTPVPLIPKQVLKAEIPATLDFSSLTTHESEGASTSKVVDSTKVIEEPSLSVDIESLKQPNVVYSPLSPSLLMSPNFMDSSFMQLDEDYSNFRISDDEQFCNFGGALQSQEIPLWEHGLFSS